MTKVSDVINREAEIQNILQQQPVDLRALHRISRLPGGFLSNRIRARVWPKLLGINRYNIPDFKMFIDPHRDCAQIRCDVERSMWNIKQIKDWRTMYRERRRVVLSEILLAILCRNPTLNYYQGLHDVVTIFMLVVEDDPLAFALSEALSRNFLVDYMKSDFHVVSKSMNLIYLLIKASDPVLYYCLEGAKLEPFFATSWLITWFAHDINGLEEAARVYDALLCSHPVFCFYLCAAYVLHLKDHLLLCDNDFGTLHNFLVHAPKAVGFPFELLLVKADELFEKIPVEALRKMCGGELKTLIKDHKIAAISKPYLIDRFVDSDWALIKNSNEAAYFNAVLEGSGNQGSRKTNLSGKTHKKKSLKAKNGKSGAPALFNSLLDHMLQCIFKWSWGTVSYPFYLLTHLSSPLNPTSPTQAPLQAFRCADLFLVSVTLVIVGFLTLQYVGV